MKFNYLWRDRNSSSSCTILKSKKFDDLNASMAIVGFGTTAVNLHFIYKLGKSQTGGCV